ncbi:MULTISPECIES: ABC transporter permease [unclassified Modestobacter]|uniref:ABC transporter permease n=1 Tax=unclassified Modestobacter TaxID=2643866 RepID=UPI0022AA19FB|nr:MULTISPECIES: ABC transporter permease [unclassified Modestobacter]MCZ2825682.1 FtsX-like permease family protein [Modestobacter sp. VKM Ac-2981]MCZ2853253.1 FtsX-like permease family protein [Modestobacter sp. VKM Ac-2982]
MLLTYVRRELRGRLRQTVIVAVGLALAIALVLVVNAASAGVRNAQDDVLESVYGVGTDITVTQAAEPGAGGGRGQFSFGAEDGTTSDDGSTTVATDQLSIARGTMAMSSDVASTISAADGVSDVTATLMLTDQTFSGELPDPGSAPTGPPAGGGGGGGGGFGGGNFDVNSFSVEGITPGATALGPLAGATVADGRGFTTADAGADVALISQSHADSADLSVGSTITLTGTAVTVVGILASDDSATTLSDVYLPIDVAQALSGLTDQVTTVYVQGTSADTVDTAAAAITAALPDATVTTQSDLASGVTGSLSSASSLVQNLGRWLSIAVLAAAFGLAVLFTISGVTRRTRDFGTLKALGWSNGRIVRQVGTESLVQGLIGGVAGLVIGLGGILALNAAGISLSGTTGGAAAATAAAGGGAEGPGAGAFGGTMPGRVGQAASSTVETVLHAPIDVAFIATGVGIALIGGLLAGVIGGWRAARLRPAAALRSLD